MDVEAHEASGTAEVIAAAEQGQIETHLSGLEMCGQCHDDFTESYMDYYHGAAYQDGSLDAPACWDCHGAHQMLPASDRRSPVNTANLIETCGQCHDDVNEEYVAYAELVHNREEVAAEVPLIQFYNATRSAIEGAVRTVTSWFES
jgi:cytochrome c553